MRKYILIIFLALLVAIFLRAFVIEGYLVRGDSMSPTLQDGDYVFIYKRAYAQHPPKRGDIVIATPRQYTQKVVKRIAVLPGESYQTGEDTKELLDPGEYFLVGDNLSVSEDSRTFGPVDAWDIKGRVVGDLRIKNLKYLTF